MCYPFFIITKYIFVIGNGKNSHLDHFLEAHR